jgi:hypothetical protein
MTMMSLLGNRLVLMLSKLVELLQLSPPRSEPVPTLSELGELLQLAFPRSEPSSDEDVSTSQTVAPCNTELLT